jgi:hypothetical protein
VINEQTFGCGSRNGEILQTLMPSSEQRTADGTSVVLLPLLLLLAKTEKRREGWGRRLDVTQARRLLEVWKGGQNGACGEVVLPLLVE